MVGITTRRNPAHNLAVVPDRFVADHVVFVGIDHPCEQTKCWPVGLSGNQGITADKSMWFHGRIKLHEAVETRFERRVERAELARPASETFLESKRVERSATKELDVEVGSGFEQRPKLID